jgi:N-acetylglucosaminyl-diphospho-decaprenol L-rhamnosyltransferase
MSLKQTSIVIVSYHTGAILFRAIEAALRQEGLKDLIIVDNGNPEDVLIQLHDMQERGTLRLISGHGNVGFSTGCNLGAAQVKSDYLLLLNPDCLLQQGSLVTAMNELENHPDAWMAGCQLTRSNGQPQGGSKRNLLTPMVAFSQSLGLYSLGEGFTPLNIDESPNDLRCDAKSGYVPAISGAFMMLPLARYKQLGGLDEDYFFHVEDLDLCYRISRDGGKILYIPTVRATHFVSTSEVTSCFVEKHKARGFLTYFKKHTELSNPVLYSAICAGIMLRLSLRMPLLLVNEKLADRRVKSRILKSQRQKALLNRYVDSALLLDKKPEEYAPVLVAGSTGQVGLSIVRRLLANDIQTYAIYHEQVVDYTHPKLEWVQGDLAANHIGNNGSVLIKNPPRTLIHTPAIWLLPARLDRYVDMGIKRIICFSSTSIEGKSKTSNPYEREMLNKFTSSENTLLKRGKDLGVEVTIIRPTMIYGFGIDRNVTSIVKFVEAFGFFPVARPSLGARQPVHTDDLANAVVTSISHPATYGNVYNLCGNTRLTYLEMVKQIFVTLERPVKVYRLPLLALLLDVFSFVTGKKDTNGEVAKRMNQDLAFSDEKARKDFGYAPRDFLAGGKSDLGLDN